MRIDRSELTEADLSRALPGAVRRRLCRGEVRSGKGLAALRRFVGMTQEEFAGAVGIGVSTLHDWEQGRRRPQGAAVALRHLLDLGPPVLLAFEAEKHDSQPAPVGGVHSVEPHADPD